MSIKYSLHSTEPQKKTTDCLVIGVWKKGKPGSVATNLDRSLNQLLSGITRSGDIKGNAGDTLLVHTPAGSAAKRVLLVGCGDKKSFDARAAIKAYRGAARALLASGSRNALITLPTEAVRERDSEWCVTQVIRECGSAAYRYDQTKSKKADAPVLKTVNIYAGGTRKSLKEAVKLGSALVNGMNAARDLGNLPGNICTPTYLAEHARKLGRQHSTLKVQALTEAQMKKLGMGSLLSVGHGSEQESRLIVIEYKGSKKTDSKPYVLVGKGITFDTGGISLKPGAAMDEMKFDMCGAASVLGTIQAVAELGLPINVVAVVAAAENMPSDRATKPGDIVTSMSGQTIEVLNTDAEGRLVLCDALTYVERFKPKTVIDVATLTGAAVAAFGDVATVVLSNHQPLADDILKFSQDAHDYAWQLPLWDEYQPLLDSNFADIANIGGPKAGTITAACFLSRFTGKYQWAHLDIAGSAWLSGAQKGATGRPVPLLLEYLRKQRA